MTEPGNLQLGIYNEQFVDNEFLDNEFLDNEFLDNEFLIVNCKL